MSSDYEAPVARLNDTYDLIKVIGTGSTSKVWLANYIDDPSKQCAIKIMRQSYMQKKKAKSTIK